MNKDYAEHAKIKTCDTSCGIKMYFQTHKKPYILVYSISVF